MSPSETICMKCQILLSVKKKKKKKGINLSSVDFTHREVMVNA